MRKHFTTFILSLLLCSTIAMAQGSTDEPIVTIKTNRYATYGADNLFQISMMATTDAGSTTIEVDFGFGRKSFTITSDGSLGEDQENEVITGGTMIEGSVSSEGVVRIYGNAADIDYLDAHGSSITEIDLSKMTALSILELGHNEIHNLDLSNMPYLEYLDLKDNEFDEGLTLGTNHPYLKYLNLNQLGRNALSSINGAVDLTPFPALRIFTAWDSHCVTSVDVSNCKYLQQLSIDNTGVKTIDTTHNEYLQILNISDCGISSIDLSHNPYLVEFYADNQGVEGAGNKLSSLDFSNNTYLQRIFCSGNNLTTLDISKQWNLVSLYANHNKLTSINGLDINLPEDQRPDSLSYVTVAFNNLTFATLPYVDPMTEFDYSSQNEIQLEKEYGVGDAGKLDLSMYIKREGTESNVALAGLSRDGYSYDYQLALGEDYEFDPETCIITFLKPQADSVQVACYNDVFDGVILVTTKFVVRSAEEYGTPVELLNFTPATSSEISFGIATREDETIYADFGNGEKIAFSTIAHQPATIEGTATGCVRLYGRVASVIETLDIADVQLYEIDINKQTGLSKLCITGCGLTGIDLGWNHMLQHINLKGNELKTLDLSGDNSAFNKNNLQTVDVSDNLLTSFNAGPSAITYTSLNLSGNMLSTIDLNDMERLADLDLSNNQITEIDLSKCTALTRLNLSGNSLTGIDLTNCTAIADADLTLNNFTFQTLPAASTALTLAPQKDVKIAGRANSIDLSSQAMVDGTATEYVWKNADNGTPLTEGTDFTISNGKTVFSESITGQTVYCEMSNAMFPEFTGEKSLRTTETCVTDMPSHVVASFTTPVGGQQALLSLASCNPDTYIYIDWGNGDLKEYALQTMYTRFNDQYTIEGAEVKIYSSQYDHGDMYVFSMDSVTVSNIDVSNMTELYCLSLCHAGLDHIDISKNLKLGEFIIEGNNFSTIDLSAHTALNMVVLTDNDLTEITLPQNNHIGWFAAAYNELSSIDTKALASAYNIDLSGNHFESINMADLHDLGQLFIAQNNLHEIDLSNHPNLMVLDISGNRFDMSTLPYPSIPVYFYGKQQPLEVECIDGKIDLSSQTAAWDTPSEIYFFEGEIELYEDEQGNLGLANYEYIEGTDFINEDGIVTFVRNEPSVTGLIVNELYPNLLLYTNTFSVNGTDGIKGASVNDNDNDNDNGNCYNIAGQRVNSSARGLIIKNGRCFIRK